MPEWTFNLKPTPASRPRVSRYGTYYGKNYTKFRKLAEFEIPKVLDKHVTYEGSVPLMVQVVSYAERPKDPTKEWPRGDVDNYAKAVLDACNGKVWEDDDQIVFLSTSKLWAPEPKVVLTVEALSSLNKLEGLLAQTARSMVKIGTKIT